MHRELAYLLRFTDVTRVTSSDVRAVHEELVNLRRRVEEGKVDGEEFRNGICYFLQVRFSARMKNDSAAVGNWGTVLRRAYTSWPHWTISNVYPVPASEKDLCPISAQAAFERTVPGNFLIRAQSTVACG